MRTDPLRPSRLAHKPPWPQRHTRPLLVVSALVLAVHVAGLMLLARPPSVGAGDDGRGTTLSFEARTLPEPALAPAPAPAPAPEPEPEPATTVQAPVAPAPLVKPPEPAVPAAGAAPPPPADAPAPVAAVPAVPPAPAADAPASAASAAPSPVPSPTVADTAGDAAIGLDRSSPMTRPWQPPKPVRLLYEVVSQTQGRTTQARGELIWRHDGRRYDALLEVSVFPFLKRTQTSVGALSEQGLLPQRFADRGRSEVAAHFRPTEGGTPARAVFSANTPDVLLKPLAQDRLSVLVQLAGWGLADPAIMAVGQSFTLQTVGPRDAQDWTFTVDDAYILELPGDNIAVYKLSRAPRREYDPLVEVWLAPTLDFMPVRVKITQSSGDFVDQKWRSTEVP